MRHAGDRLADGTAADPTAISTRGPHLGRCDLARAAETVDAGGERLSYRTLDVEQIGVYETMMGFRLEVACGATIASSRRRNTARRSGEPRRPARGEARGPGKNTEQVIEAGTGSAEALKRADSIDAARGWSGAVPATPRQSVKPRER